MAGRRCKSKHRKFQAFGSPYGTTMLIWCCGCGAVRVYDKIEGWMGPRWTYPTDGEKADG